MKNLFTFLLISLLATTAYSQTPIDTADLRGKINSWIVPNNNRQITATKVNQLFNGIADLMKAYAVDSAYRIADTLFLTRRGGFTTVKVTLKTNPAGSNTQIQWNNSGSFGASPNLFWDNLNNLVSIVDPLTGAQQNLAGAQINIVMPDPTQTPNISIYNDANNQLQLGISGSSAGNTAYLESIGTKLNISTDKSIVISPTDSIRIKLNTATTADSVVAVNNFQAAGSTNKLVKVPVSALSAKNISNTDLTWTGDRFHNAAGYYNAINDLDGWYLQTAAHTGPGFSTGVYAYQDIGRNYIDLKVANGLDRGWGISASPGTTTLWNFGALPANRSSLNVDSNKITFFTGGNNPATNERMRIKGDGQLQLNAYTAGSFPAADTTNYKLAVIDENGNLFKSSWIGGGATGADPTATIGLTAVNGSAATFMRSDASPALSQAIAPVWTGSHTFTSLGTATVPGIGVKNTAPLFDLWNTSVASNDQRRWGMQVTSTGGVFQLRAYNDDGSTGNNGIAMQIFRNGNSANDMHLLNVSGTSQVMIHATNGVTMAKLAGTGTRIVTANSTGLLSATQPVYAFSNGLTETSGATKLGGTLTETTTINTGGFGTVWTGANNSATSFTVINTGSTNGNAIAGTATSGSGVNGTSTSGIGVLGSSSSNYGVVGTSSSTAAIRGQINVSSTNTIQNVVALLRTSSSGAGANGIGAAIQYELETATNGNSQTAGSLAFKWIDATSATRTSAFEVFTVNNTTNARKLALAGNGQLTLDGYGSGTFTGTVANLLAVTSDGNVIETPMNTGSIVVVDDANHTVTSTQSAIRYHNNITASRTVTIPDPGGVTNREIWIKWNTINSGASLNITTTSGTALIYLDGTASSSTYNITASFQSACLKSDGTSWYKIN